MRPAHILAFVVAGLAAPFLWTAVETQLISWLPMATSWVMWRGIQVFVGFVAAVVLVGPLVLIVRPTTPMYSVIFIAAFFGFEFFAIEHTEGLAMLFQLPDTWVFLGTSALLIWWAASRYVHRSAA